MASIQTQPPSPPRSPGSSNESPIHVTRKRTPLEQEVNQRIENARAFVSTLPGDALGAADAYLPGTLSNAIFCGHLVTDLDSIAGAIGAAELYNGIAARASEVNSETAFALDKWGVEKPLPIEELLETHPQSGVCLVDHQQTSQLNQSIPVERIVGVIDHHALQNSTIITDMPIYIDIRPWGSMSTIIAHSFMMYRRRPTIKTAGLLLCAILSDTLNLQGPTTTEWDRLMVTVLSHIANVKDVQLLASRQFKAKSSELSMLTSYQLITGDQKVFTFKTDFFEGSIGFAVIETTDDEVIMNRSNDIKDSMFIVKDDRGLSLLYLAVVNIVQLRSHLILIDINEVKLAKLSFPDCASDEFMPNEYTMNLGSRVSRKMDFIPAITRSIKEGFIPEKPTNGIIKCDSSDVMSNELETEEDSHDHDRALKAASNAASFINPEKQGIVYLSGARRL